jgi:hypothetical protein
MDKSSSKTMSGRSLDDDVDNRAMPKPDSEAEDFDLSFSSAPPRYYSYLLRFWEERGEQAAQTVWRFSLEDPQTAQRQSFADLKDLIKRLKTQMQNPAIENTPGDHPRRRRKLSAKPRLTTLQ